MDADFLFEQPIDGIPIMTIAYGGYVAYAALAKPSKIEKVSDNESYAIFSGPEKAAKLTVKTEGSGNIRTNITATLEEVAIE